MMSDKDQLPEAQQKRRYVWPWLVLGAVVLALALAAAWMSREVERTRRIRDASAPAPQTDRSAPDSPRR